MVYIFISQYIQYSHYIIYIYIFVHQPLVFAALKKEKVILGQHLLHSFFAPAPQGSESFGGTGSHA